MDHFLGITPKERYDNELLNELRAIRKLLERDAQTLQQAPEKQEHIKRQYNRRGAKNG